MSPRRKARRPRPALSQWLGRGAGEPELSAHELKQIESALLSRNELTDEQRQIAASLVSVFRFERFEPALIGARYARKLSAGVAYELERRGARQGDAIGAADPSARASSKRREAIKAQLKILKRSLKTNPDTYPFPRLEPTPAMVSKAIDRLPARSREKLRK